MTSTWWAGPSNAIDRLIYAGHDAIEISRLLEIDIWIIRERFAQYHAQRSAPTNPQHERPAA
ncbi:MAG: hypothetical protein ABIP33_06360 [Pseudolysinimonas sp.]